MSTHALREGVHSQRIALGPSSRQLLWLGGGLVLGFLVPFFFADVLGLARDLYYGIYALVVAGYAGLWFRATQGSFREVVSRRLALTLGLAAASSAVLVAMVYRTEEATSRPDGLELLGAILWRGVVYGAIDGFLLSVFPILAVFGAFAGTRLRRSRSGTVAVALIALSASLAMTAVYHVGYADFRGEKLRKPVAGDVVWSAPTLLTLNPVGAPIAHVALHTAAVLHIYDTDTFLPPHEGS